MAWSDITPAEIQKETSFEKLPVGQYTCRLRPGASVKLDKNNVEQLTVAGTVTDGEFAGRLVFLSYPDPTAKSSTGKPMAWSAQAFKVLESALGTAALPTESSVDYLNRVATDGTDHLFSVKIDSRANPNEGGEPFVKPNIFSVAQATA